MTPKQQWDVKIPLRDRTNLAANVFFPEGDGPYPVLLNRTPYVKDTSLRLKRAMTYVKAGYAVVNVDVRGRGNSDGRYDPYFQEIEDGHDCLEWCGIQPWSTGKVGTYGGSYEGWTQIFPTRLQSRYHKAAFLTCTPSMHPFHEGAYHDGVPSALMGMWTLYTSGKTCKEQISELDWEKSVNVRPLRDLIQSLGVPSGSYREEHMQHEVFDSYFKRLWPEDGVLNKTLVPCYHVTGWFDDNQKGTLDHFPALALKHPDPEVRRSQRLLIGPWPHRLSGESSKLGDFDYGPHSLVPLQQEAIRWFDYWLKGVKNGIMDEPRARLFLMGANKWMDADALPVPEARAHVLNLGADGPANSLLGKGTLGQGFGPQPSSHFTYDPARPAPTPFWKENFQNGTNEDLRPIQRRDDVLVFTTPPLAQPLNVVGMLKAELAVSTSARDTDFVCRLSDVSPSGYAQRLNHGICRLRFRDGYERARPVEAGEVMRVAVDMWATGHQFKAGHRIRLEVTSSAFPTWAPNFNTGGSIWDETEPVIAEQTVWHSPEHPSQLILPVVDQPRFVDGWRESRWS